MRICSLDRQSVVGSNQHDGPEVRLQPIDRGALAEGVGAAAFEQGDADAARGEGRGGVKAARHRDAFDLVEIRIDRGFDRQHRSGPVSDVAGPLDAPNRSRRPFAGADHDDRFAPPGPAAGRVDNDHAGKWYRQQAENQRQHESDAGIERRQPQGEGKRREDEESESGDVGEAAEDFDRAETQARIKSSLRIAENE